MSGTVAFVGRGSKLNIQTGVSPTVWTEIAQLQKVAFGGIKVATDDVTNLDSPSAFKEIIPTIIDPGEITYSGILNAVQVAQGYLLTYCQAMTLINWQIVLSDGVTTISGAGYVTEHAPASNIEPTKALAFSGKITITGPITIVS